MKELLRDKDAVMLTYIQGILKEAGIHTFIRNEYSSDGFLGSGSTWMETCPALMVVNDEDFPMAKKYLTEHLCESSQGYQDEEIPCPECGEMNPGNFDVCWSCESNLYGDIGEDGAEAESSL